MGALHINGQKTTGLNINLADGVFIDTDNVIVAKTSYTPSTFSYTATEDCALYIEIPAKGGYSTFLEIDGKEVQGVNLAGSSTNYLIATALLKKGQTATLSSSSFPSVNPDYAVYGIQQGTIEGKLQPVIYSTEEREVGVWTDGRPLYQKTYVFDIDDLVNGTISSSLMDGQFILDQLSYGMLEMVDAFFTNIGGQNSVKSNPANYANGDTYVRANIQYESNAQKYIIYFKLTYSVANLYSDRDYLKFYFRIQYTKTTDQPGSGTWTPDGAYAHHYSTDEKVIGTWVDGSTLYEKTYDLGQDVTIKYNEWTEVNATKPNGISKYINIFGTQDDGTGIVLTGANPANATFSNVRLSTRRFQDESVRWFTIQYTKSS